MQGLIDATQNLPDEPTAEGFTSSKEMLQVHEVDQEISHAMSLAGEFNVIAEWMLHAEQRNSELSSELKASFERIEALESRQKECEVAMALQANAINGILEEVIQHRFSMEKMSRAYKSENSRKRPRLCISDGCSKHARGLSLLCSSHGGGVRCAMHGCSEGARDTKYCEKHAIKILCAKDGCPQKAVARSQFCRYG